MVLILLFFYFLINLFFYFNVHCVLSVGMSLRDSDLLELELDSYKLPCWYWELNPGPLEEQLVFSTAEHLSSP